MEHVYAVTTADELAIRQRFVREHQNRLEEYVRFLEREYSVAELPRSIVWTTLPIATQLVSSIPLPAYTNDFRVIFDPELEDWRRIYLAQLDGLPESDALKQIRDHYERGLSQNHVLQILGHELAHHSQLFPEGPEDYFSGSIWFEEGMVEYIGRQYFLTEAEFNSQAEADRLLVELLEPRYGGRSLEEFGGETYQRDYAGIFFDYRRSFLAIQRLVNQNGGNVQAVFHSFQRWHGDAQVQTLAQWFELEP